MSQDKKYKIKFANKIIKNYLTTKKSKKVFLYQVKIYTTSSIYFSKIFYK